MEGEVTHPPPAEATGTPLAPNATPEVAYMIGLAENIQQSLDELPPNVPENRKSNEFWDAVSILKLPGIQYGDATLGPEQSDERGEQRCFDRPIFDESGNEIGRWRKMGFFRKGELSYFSESIRSPEGHQEVQVAPRKDNKIGSIRRQTLGRDLRLIEDRELEYKYDGDGNVERTIYRERGRQGNEISKKEYWTGLGEAITEPVGAEPLPTSPPPARPAPTFESPPSKTVGLRNVFRNPFRKG